MIISKAAIGISENFTSRIFPIERDDLRKLPLHLRKNNLARLLARRSNGIFVSEFEQGAIGPDLFRKACEFSLEGLVSKHRDRAYRGGTAQHWVEVKNPKHPAMNRVKDARHLISGRFFSGQ